MRDQRTTEWKPAQWPAGPTVRGLRRSHDDAAGQGAQVGDRTARGLAQRRRHHRSRRRGGPRPAGRRWEPLDRAAISNIAPETANFQALCADSSEGILTRFVQDKLNLVFWIKPPEAVNFVFGCVIDAAELGCRAREDASRMLQSGS